MKIFRFELECAIEQQADLPSIPSLSRRRLGRPSAGARSPRPEPHPTFRLPRCLALPGEELSNRRPRRGLRFLPILPFPE